MVSCEIMYPDQSYIEAMGAIFELAYDPNNNPIKRNGDHQVTLETFEQLGISPRIIGMVYALYERRSQPNQINWGDPNIKKEAEKRFFAKTGISPNGNVAIEDRVATTIRIAQLYAEKVFIQGEKRGGKKR